MRRTAARCVFLSLLALVVGSPIALAAQAAPSMIDSQPAAGEEMHKAPDKVAITFDQPLDPESSISIENHCGDRTDDRHTRVTGNQMEVDLASSYSGTYHVTYFSKGLGGVTGQQTGTFTFVVHGGPACGPGGETHPGGHEGGGGHGNGGHEGNHGGNHAGGGSDPGSHTGGNHETSSHASSEHEPTHEGPGNMGAGHDGHTTGGRSGNDRETHDGSQEENGISIAGAPDGPRLRGPDTTAVVLALSLCVLMGALGGAVLRISGPR